MGLGFKYQLRKLYSFHIPNRGRFVCERGLLALSRGALLLSLLLYPRSFSVALYEPDLVLSSGDEPRITFGAVPLK